MDELQADGFPATEDTEREVAHRLTREPGPGLSAPWGRGSRGSLLNLLVRWEEAHRGARVRRRRLCAGTIALAAVLRERIAKRKRLRRSWRCPPRGTTRKASGRCPSSPVTRSRGRSAAGAWGWSTGLAMSGWGGSWRSKTLAEAGMPRASRSSGSWTRRCRRAAAAPEHHGDPCDRRA